MAGRARCWTAHLVLMLMATARCSVGQQPQQPGEPLDQLLALVSSAVEAATGPIVAELGSQRALLDSIVSRLEVQDDRLDLILDILNSQDARLGALNASLQTLNTQCVNSSVAAALQAPPRDCSDLPTGAGTGIYTLRPGRGVGDLTDASALCDMDTAGGGWTVIQRRAYLLPRQSFFLDWAAYREGFGNFTGEFWWGLEKVWLLTSSQDRQYELRIDFDFDGNIKHAVYQGFAISSEKDGYRLTCGNYSGDARDMLSYHFGQQFSTKDRDCRTAIGTDTVRRYTRAAGGTTTVAGGTTTVASPS